MRVTLRGKHGEPLSLVTSMGNGAGTPWGPMESGRPQTPNYEAYDTNPNDFKGFDYSPMAAAAKNEIALGGGNAQRQYLAGQSKLLGSGTTSGSNSGQLANIAAQTEKNQNNAANQFAQEGYQSQMQQMDAFNRAKQLANSLKAGQYGQDLGAYGQEEQGRGAAIGGLTGGLADILGRYLGKS